MGLGLCNGMVNLLFWSPHGGFFDETRLLYLIRCTGLMGGLASSGMFLFTGVAGVYSSIYLPNNIQYIPKRLLISSALQFVPFLPLIVCSSYCSYFEKPSKKHK
jgi:hypothetical protein